MSTDSVTLTDLGLAVLRTAVVVTIAALFNAFARGVVPARLLGISLIIVVGVLALGYELVAALWPAASSRMRKVLFGALVVIVATQLYLMGTRGLVALVLAGGGVLVLDFAAVRFRDVEPWDHLLAPFRLTSEDSVFKDIETGTGNFSEETSARMSSIRRDESDIKKQSEYHCPSCGTDLRELLFDGYCPNCGIKIHADRESR